MPSNLIVFYDSSCATCHFLVRFILARKVRNRFLFIPLNQLLSYLPSQARDSHSQLLLGESLAVVQNGRIVQRTEAIFSILEILGLPWRLLLIFKLVPRSLRDALYDLFASYRFKLFGKAEPAAICAFLEPDKRILIQERLPADFRVLP